MVRAEEQDLSPAMSRHIKALKSEIDHGIRRLIREGVQDGSIHPCDPKMTAFALAGALNWIAHWYREDQSLSGAQIAEAFVTVFEAGLRPRASAAHLPRHARRRAGARAARTRPGPLTPPAFSQGHRHVHHRSSSSSPPSAPPSGRSWAHSHPLSAVQLGSGAAEAAISRGRHPARRDLEEVILGCVLPAGLGPGAGAPGGDRCGRARRASRPPRSTRCAAQASRR